MSSIDARERSHVAACRARLVDEASSSPLAAHITAIEGTFT